MSSGYWTIRYQRWKEVDKHCGKVGNQIVSIQPRLRSRSRFRPPHSATAASLEQGGTTRHLKPPPPPTARRPHTFQSEAQALA
jgi:hypothetical protein